MALLEIDNRRNISCRVSKIDRSGVMRVRIYFMVVLRSIVLVGGR